jgi:hypothetical protein
MLLVVGIGGVARLAWSLARALVQSAVMGGSWVAPRAARLWRTLRPKTASAQPVVEVPPQPETIAISSIDYTCFKAFCQLALFEGRRVDLDASLVDAYLHILEDARIVQKHVNGSTTWTLRPRIRSLKDITDRIPAQSFERALYVKLMAQPHLGEVGVEETGQLALN